MVLKYNEFISVLEKNSDELNNLILDIQQKFEGVKLELYESNGQINLSKIIVPKDLRDQGVGKQIMDIICEFSDEKDLVITLTPSTDYGASSVARLKKFYKGFDFVENKGRNKDFEISELMYRLPK